jgi:hypothetical protein
MWLPRRCDRPFIMIETPFARLWFGSRLLASVLVLAACSDGAGPIVVPPPSPIHVLTLVTYDGSGQAVHPDVAITPPSWGGAATQLFVTPYPNGDASKENPSLYAGSLFDWLVPAGVTNPIARPASGYLSDPDEVFNPETNELWLYYRGVTTENQIFLIKGSGPSHWTTPTMVASAPNHSIVSPTVVRRGAGDWLMWSVNSGVSGCVSGATTVELRRSSDGITWSDPVTTDLREPNAFAWHIDVEWIPSRQEFWATYNVKVPGSCTTAALDFAESADGLHWVPAAAPVLTRGAIPEFSDIVYRASLLYDDTTDGITLWYSGARFENDRYTWRIATEELSRSDFFARIGTPHPSGASITTAPPLTAADAP